MKKIWLILSLISFLLLSACSTNKEQTTNIKLNHSWTKVEINNSKIKASQWNENWVNIKTNSWTKAETNNSEIKASQGNSWVSINTNSWWKVKIEIKNEKTVNIKPIDIDKEDEKYNDEILNTVNELIND